MGNPSDGFFGKTISLSIANFWAEVSVWPSARLRIVPHPLNDPTSFGSLADLHGVVDKEGYAGGVRLLLAVCKKFHAMAAARGLSLPKRNFTMAYDTNVPRQVGLAGSSAILTAALKALMAFYGLGDAQMPKVSLPNFILSVEKEELGINAGLQDRVIQVYEGAVHMDFDRAHMEAEGHGIYTLLPPALLPPLWLAYLADPSDSGRIHSTVRQKWDAGDVEVREGMREFGRITDDALAAIHDSDAAALGRAMDANFATRRRLFGDPTLGEANLMMVGIAQRHGVPVKFPGSGGAVIGLCVGAAAMRAMRDELERNGAVFCNLAPNGP